MQQENETITLPWVGGRVLRSKDRAWQLEAMPAEFGWYTFSVSGRRARMLTPSDPMPDALTRIVLGYLIGDRLISDDVHANGNPVRFLNTAPRVYLIEAGLDRFVRVSAGYVSESGPLIYRSLEMPLGPEGEVLSAYLNRKESADGISNVTPALDAAFRVETWRRAEAERIRQEEEERRRKEEEQRRKEELRRQVFGKLGDSVGRREMAQLDFGEAAKAALAIGGAEYLDYRSAYHRSEAIVRFRVDRQRFECVCDRQTLRIVDAGICLTSHETGVRGDERFSLESLPSVIREATRLGVLVVFRHVDL